MFNNLKFIDCVKGFIDQDEDKQKKGYCNKPVESIVSFLSRDKGEHLVVIAARQQNTALFKNQLRAVAYYEGENLFEVHSFLQFYLPIYYLYVWDKVYLPSLCLMSTTKCNLNCESCLVFTPYNKNKRHNELEKSKHDIDTLFKTIDIMGLFHISGGEPFLYPDLIELLSYIKKNYGDRISKLWVTTNGTIIPTSELCEALSELNIKVILNDYTKQVELCNKNIDKIISKFVENGVEFELNTVATWIDLAPYKTDNSWMKERGLVNYCTVCQVPYRSLREGRVYSCNYNDYAIKAEIVEEYENDYYSLKDFVPHKREELIEFLLGYTDRGYSELCKKCAGYIGLNRNQVPVAKQYSK